MTRVLLHSCIVTREAKFSRWDTRGLQFICSHTRVFCFSACRIHRGKGKLLVFQLECSEVVDKPLFGCAKMKQGCGGDITVTLWSRTTYGVSNGPCKENNITSWLLWLDHGDIREIWLRPCGERERRKLPKWSYFPATFHVSRFQHKKASFRVRSQLECLFDVFESFSDNYKPVFTPSDVSFLFFVNNWPKFRHLWRQKLQKKRVDV